MNETNFSAKCENELDNIPNFWDNLQLSYQDTSQMEEPAELIPTVTAKMEEPAETIPIAKTQMEESEETIPTLTTQIGETAAPIIPTLNTKIGEIVTPIPIELKDEEEKIFQANGVLNDVTKRRKPGKLRISLYQCSPAQLFQAIFGNKSYENCSFETIPTKNKGKPYHEAILKVEGITYTGRGKTKKKARGVAIHNSLKAKLAVMLSSALTNSENTLEHSNAEEDDSSLWHVIVAYAVTQLYESVTENSEEVGVSVSPRAVKRPKVKSQASNIMNKKQKLMPPLENVEESYYCDRDTTKDKSNCVQQSNQAQFGSLLHSKGFVKLKEVQANAWTPEIKEEFYDCEYEDYEPNINYNYYTNPCYNYYSYDYDMSGSTLYPTTSSVCGTWPNPLRQETEEPDIKPPLNMPAKKIPADATTRNPLSVLNELMPGTQFNVSQVKEGPLIVFTATIKLRGVMYYGRGATKKHAKAAAAVDVLKSEFGIENQSV